MRKRPSKFSPNPSFGAELPIAISPSGRRINSVEELPELPLPKKVIVDGDALRVDEWIFRLWPIGRRTLGWLGQQAGRWCHDDPSPENKAQVTGVIDAIESIILKKRQDEQKQAEFDF